MVRTGEWNEKEEDYVVGFIGLRNMGGPIAKHILDAGHAVTVYDVRKEAAATHLQAIAVTFHNAGSYDSPPRKTRPTAS
jgi:6-phosphogluconate dehydrogenase (decarboxylating)